jgi:Ca2+-binding EF-hand superfamily protein
VSVSNLVLGVNIALNQAPVSACPAFDPDGDGRVTIAELIQAVGNALNGCPP